MTVKSENERKVELAMKTLVDGQSQKTNGDLTVTNLAREAGVSRSTVKRLPHLVAEFRQSAVGIKQDDIERRAHELSRRLQLKVSREAELEEEINVLAHQVHSLALENAALADRLAKLGDNVSPIASRRTSSRKRSKE